MTGEIMFEVSNQPPPLEPYNLLTSDIVLRAAVKRERAAWADGELTALGATLGQPETIQLGFDANKYTPTLRTLDRYGHRLDEVDFHPAWHALLEIALKAGLHSSPWADPKPGAHVARAAGTYMLGQIERRRSRRNGCRAFSRATTTAAFARHPRRLRR